jgi:fatty-acyl-CoA synthase
VRLLSALGRHAAQLTDKPAVIDDFGSVTYGELDAVTARVAGMLAGLGVRAGDVVALAIEPTAPGAALMLGTMRLGAVAAPLNTRLAPPEIAAYLSLISPAVSLADPAAGVVPEGARVFGQLDAPLPLLDRLELREAGPVELPAELPEIPGDAGAIALPTGGTTGLPKAALWSRSGLSETTISNAIHLGVRRYDRELYISPLFHIAIVAGLLPTLYAGGTVRMLGRFAADPAAALFDEFKPTRMWSTPVAFTRILDRLPEDSQRAARPFTLTYGAARDAAGFRGQVRAKLPGARLITGYGSTETGPVTRLYDEDPEAAETGAIGHPVAEARVAVAGQDGQPLPPGEVGELLISVPWHITGYLGTDETPWAKDGSVRLGDLGRAGADGGLFISGRSKEMIKTGGENVFPGEVERVIQLHAAVADTGVYGMPDETWGERVEAAVMLRDGADLDAAELRAFCAARLAGYKVPKVFRLVPSIPYTPNLKLDRRQLQADAGAARG